MLSPPFSSRATFSPPSCCACFLFPVWSFSVSSHSRASPWSEGARTPLRLFSFLALAFGGCLGFLARGLAHGLRLFAQARAVRSLATHTRTHECATQARVRHPRVRARSSMTLTRTHSARGCVCVCARARVRVDWGLNFECGVAGCSAHGYARARIRLHTHARAHRQTDTNTHTHTHTHTHLFRSVVQGLMAGQTVVIRLVNLITELRCAVCVCVCTRARCECGLVDQC